MTEVEIRPPRCDCGHLYQDHLGDQPGEIVPGGACTDLDCDCETWRWLGD